MPWRWCRRRGGRGRPHSILYLSHLPSTREFIPSPLLIMEPVKLTYPEFEVLRMSDLEKLTQEEIAKRMKTSRTTVWRLLESAREKVARALVESRILVISLEGELESTDNSQTD
ncbi:MAG: DUF134 domain-containing protein [Thermoplasmata archaeon]